MTRSPARLLAGMAERVQVELHGACIGAGIELAAFARRVVARPDTRIHLPEIRMGLIPGAGGTASLPRRIGRQRTAFLALSGRWVDAETARAWGLVDALAEIPVHP
jgi:enoyl-CoA hydratase/carnithine racemase